MYRHYHSQICGVLLMALMVFGGLLAGCRSTAPKTGSALTVWTMQLSAFSAVIQPMLRAFEARHPGVRVQWVDVPFSEMEKRVMLGLLGGHPPNVVNLNPAFSTLLAQRGALVDMGQALTPAAQAAYLPVAWSAVTWQSKTAAVRFGVPWYLTTALTFWNTRLLSANLLPRTWPELLRLKPVNGTFLTLPAVTEHGALLRWLAKQGVSPCESAAVNWLALLSSGLDQADFPQDMITATHRSALERFQQGKLTMLVAGGSVLNLLAENTPQRLPDIRITPQFGQQTQVIDVATMLLAVPVNASHRALSIELAQWMTNHVNQLALAQAAPVLPSVKSALMQMDKLPVTLKGQPVTNKALRRLMVEARRQGVRQLSQAVTGLPLYPAEVDDQVDALAQQLLLHRLTPVQTAKRLCATLKEQSVETPWQP